MLRDLVEAGSLPPVAARVGPEPAVMRGVDGIGKYGGTWLRIATSPGDVSVIRWQHEIQAKCFGTTVPSFLRVAGEAATVTRIDDYTAQIAFAAPNALFMKQLALDSMNMLSPEHYLRPFHPELGDPAFIKARMAAYGLASPRGLYREMQNFQNPEHPRLWPWIPTEYRNLPPHAFVRNPYYCVVDSEGNQLPYIDRVQFDVQDRTMLGVAAANGKVGMQARHLGFDQYTEFMSRRASAGTRIYLWYPLFRSDFVINPNLNRRVDPAEPATRWKAALLADRHFRQALSLAIDRPTIIRAYYHGLTQPSQVEPGPDSPFHAPQLARAFIAYEPARASAMLDEIWRALDGDPRARDGEAIASFRTAAA